MIRSAPRRTSGQEYGWVSASFKQRYRTGPRRTPFEALDHRGSILARILTLTNWYPPHHFGGYELSCHDVVRGLVARGHDVTVLCSDHRRRGAAVLAPDPAHERLVRRELAMYWRDDAPWRPPLRARRAIERHNLDVLARTLDEATPDVASIWHLGALSLGLVTMLAERGIPLVYSVCDDWLTYATRLDPWAGLFDGWVWKQWLGRALRPLVRVPTAVGDLGATGAFCFASDLTRRRAQDDSPWAYPRQAIVHLGIQRSSYPPTPDSPPEREWRWRLLYTGRFDPRKGLDTVLRALALLPPQATLACYGAATTDELDRVRRLADELGIAGRVTFGELARDDLAPAYARADVFVFPSEWPEPFGLVPLEAMACGTPVVATRTGGSAEFLVDGWNCVAYAPGDVAALAGAVRRLGDDPELRRALALGGYRSADAFTTDRLVEATEEWLVAAATGYPTGSPAPRPLDLGPPAGSAPGPAQGPGPGPASGLQPPAGVDPLARHQADSPRVIATGDPGAIKALYVDLGDRWWAARSAGAAVAAVLSAPETAPAVLGRLASVRGLVLDAGCGPNPAVSIGLAGEPARTVVAVDIGWGTVCTARATAAGQGLVLLGVAADVERLPFRDGAFDGVVCDDTLEHLPDDVAGAAELARVQRRSGTAVLATPNRHSAAVVMAKGRDRVLGVRKPAASYFCSNSHLREYTWAEFERLVGAAFRVRARVPVGWRDGRKARLTPLLRLGPLRRLSQMIVLEVEPK